MGNGGTKENQNVYFRARKQAAMYNERLSSREGAAEMLGISPSTLADYELGITKFVPVDKVVLMADLYNCPELRTGYCKYECPIGKHIPLATSVSGIEGIALRLITKKKLQSYRRVKASLAETEEFTEDEKIELRWAFVRDLMGSGLDVVEKADNRIRSVENKRKRDSFEIQSIDKAMALYKKEADNSSSEEAKRRYRELHAMYIDDEAHDVKEIAEMENISEKIVYRDIGIACKILAVYLLGM